MLLWAAAIAGWCKRSTTPCVRKPDDLCSAGIDKRLTAAQVKARLRDLKQGG
jgi:hypothetical protein